MNNYISLPIISEELFKQNSPISENVDIKVYTSFFNLVQDMYIEPIIGTPLLDELKEQVLTNSLTTHNSTLILKIAPVLSTYTVYQALPFHWASIINKGVTIRESENSKGIDLKDMAQLRTYLENTASLLEQSLIKFLCSCRSNYPSWRPSNANCCNDVINEGNTNKSNHSFGFHFPNKKQGGCGCN